MVANNASTAPACSDSDMDSDMEVEKWGELDEVGKSSVAECGYPHAEERGTWELLEGVESKTSEVLDADMEGEGVADVVDGRVNEGYLAYYKESRERTVGKQNALHLNRHGLPALGPCPPRWP